MNRENARKLSYFVNTLLLGFVLLMHLFFWAYHVNILVYFGIPTIMVYIINYFLITKDQLDYFIRLVYFWITLYMGVTTVCLGIDYGFHLYSMSMIPVIFCTEYMAYQMNARSPKAVLISIGLAIIDVISTVYTMRHGAIYTIEGNLSTGFFIFNAAIVFSFLIFYTNLLLRMIVNSEKKLKEMALMDRLTGLYNRHYMLDYLNNLKADMGPKYWVAMVDLDNFKKINDGYGHNGGDYVLVNLSEIMKKECENCFVSRWGGEEFLIMADGEQQDMAILEKLRKEVEGKELQYEGKEVQVTITIGVANYQVGESIDQWINRADERLYYGKNHGKNQLVI